MPTLSEKNKVVSQKWMTSDEKEQVENEPAKNFLLSFITDRIWINQAQPPKIMPKSPGSKVLVLRSGTGSGKSTMLPPALFNAFFEEMHKGIIITQPTIATTTDIPFQIIQYNKNLVLGDTIGYQTSTLARKPIKGILFCTVGILLQFLRTMDDETFTKKYGFIIIDEIHNRSVEIDSVLFKIKQLLSRIWDKPECPFIILMSGTFEPKVFMDYFKCPKEHFIDVLGSSYPIKDTFTKFDVTNYMEYVIDKVEHLHVNGIEDITSQTQFRDILVFVQGSAQIVELAKRIHWLNANVLSKGLTYAQKHSGMQQAKYKGGGPKKKINDDIYYLAPISVMSKNIQKGGREYKDLYSDIASVQVELYDFEDDEYKPMSDLPETYEMVQASRRIILATNAIETGLTIDTLKYCIDTGYVKEASFNPNFGCYLLIDKNVTQASSRQRRGRAGRKAPGEFYACYTKEVYDNLPTLQFPDIVREDISLFLLDILITETNAQEVEIGNTSHIRFDNVKVSGVRVSNGNNNDHDAYATISYQKNNFDQKTYHLEYDAPFDAKKLDFIQYPSADNMEYSIEKMHALGFIDHEYKPTLIGLYGAKFRKLSLENIRMILAGYAHGCNVLDLITIACCIEMSFEIGAPSKSYKTRNPLGLPDAEAIYYTKTVFCDEFIEFIFLWHDFMQVLNKMGDKYISNIKQSKKKLFPYGYLEDWCEEVGVKLDGLISAIALRDEVISDMMTAGLNPFYNGLDIPEGRYSLVEILNRNLLEGLDEIKKLKQCIYDGYYLNVYIWNDMIKGYASARMHNTVSLMSKLVKNITHTTIEQSKPQKIIIGDVMLRESMNNKGMYEFTGSIISVLDGFVEYDPTFI